MNLLSTIRVPKNLLYLTDRLPKPNYDADRSLREKEEMRGTVTAMPQREDITLPIDEQLIVELYSR